MVEGSLADPRYLERAYVSYISLKTWRTVYIRYKLFACIG